MLPHQISLWVFITVLSFSVSCIAHPHHHNTQRESPPAGVDVCETESKKDCSSSNINCEHCQLYWNNPPHLVVSTNTAFHNIPALPGPATQTSQTSQASHPNCPPCLPQSCFISDNGTKIGGLEQYASRLLESGSLSERDIIY